MARFPNYLRLFLVLITSEILTLTTASLCPQQCECDLYKSSNRALCNNQNLMSAVLDVPENVEILSYSENDITTLIDHTFQGYNNLKNLSLSKNSIHTISLDAFSDLISLEHLDLSYNRLEMFDDRIFELNKKLSSLNLSGNKFMSLSNQPLIISSSLTRLGLKNSQLAHVHSLFFVKVPKLREIDLSENLLITIDKRPFVSLYRLRIINLKFNRWNCDNNLGAAIEYLRNRKINVHLDKCLFPTSTGGGKFERMMMGPGLPALFPMSTTQKPEFDTKGVWKSHSNASSICPTNATELCMLYQRCEFNKSHLNSASSKFTVLVIFVSASVTGFVVGVVMVSTYNFIAKNLCKKRKTVDSNDSRTPLHVENIRTPRESRLTPLERRNAIRRRSPPLNRSLSSPEQRGNGEVQQNDFATFISRLFERPTRNRYCRRFNENTAHMIRRLSRSNLFIRTSDQTNTRNAREENDSQDTDQLINYGRNSTAEQHETDANSNSPRVNLPPRAETPPPAYKDVVIRIKH